MSSAQRLVNVGIVPEQAKEIAKAVTDAFEVIEVPAISDGSFYFPGGSLKDFAEYVANLLDA